MTIDEQIRYMESELTWYQDYCEGSVWERELNACEAILTTLKQVKQDKILDDLMND